MLLECFSPGAQRCISFTYTVDAVENGTEHNFFCLFCRIFFFFSKKRRLVRGGLWPGTLLRFRRSRSRVIVGRFMNE